MVSSLVITLREGLEAALLLGILFVMLDRTGSRENRRWVWLGTAAAVLTSLAAGAAMFATGAELEGAAEEAFEAGAMLAAASMLAWVIVWMSRRAPRLKGEIGGKVAAAAGSAAALFWLAFVLVGREGLETALFLFAAAGSTGSPAAVLGGVTGLAVAAGLGYAVYRGGSRLDLRTVFTVLNVLLIGLGAYLVWRGAGELGELGAGGEAGELAGPVAAGLYAGAMTWLLLRGRRRVSGLHPKHHDLRPAEGAQR